jgi:hypothetical protein
LKVKVEQMAEEMAKVDEIDGIDLKKGKEGEVKATLSKRSKYSGTLTIKGELDFDPRSGEPQKMEVKENLFGAGMGFTVNENRRFTFEDTKDQKIYTMKHFGARQTLRLDKNTGLFNYEERKLGIVNEKFDFDYDDLEARVKESERLASARGEMDKMTNALKGNEEGILLESDETLTIDGVRLKRQLRKMGHVPGKH